jgi:hypothetical protein
VEPEIPIVPHVDVVAPGAEAALDGADHSAGTAIVNSPELSVAPAVYVNVSVFPLELATTFAGDTVTVPVPSAAIAGAAPRASPRVAEMAAMIAPFPPIRGGKHFITSPVGNTAPELKQNAVK